MNRRIVTADPHSANRRNRRHLWVIAGLCTIGAAVVAGALLVPSPDIVAGQLERETQRGTTPTLPTDPKERPQILAGPNGSTFIVGDHEGLIGLDVPILDIVNARDKTGFPDRVLVRNVEVQTVPGDQVFSIGPTRGQSVLVKIEEPTLTPALTPEHALVVRPGQRVAVSGSVERIGSLDTLTKQFGVSGYEAGQLGNTTLYLRADTVQILGR